MTLDWAVDDLDIGDATPSARADGIPEATVEHDADRAPMPTSPDPDAVTTDVGDDWDDLVAPPSLGRPAPVVDHPEPDPPTPELDLARLDRLEFELGRLTTVLDDSIEPMAGPAVTDRRYRRDYLDALVFAVNKRFVRPRLDVDARLAGLPDQALANPLGPRTPAPDIAGNQALRREVKNLRADVSGLRDEVAAMGLTLLEIQRILAASATTIRR